MKFITVAAAAVDAGVYVWSDKMSKKLSNPVPLTENALKSAWDAAQHLRLKRVADKECDIASSAEETMKELKEDMNSIESSYKDLDVEIQKLTGRIERKSRKLEKASEKKRSKLTKNIEELNTQIRDIKRRQLVLYREKKNSHIAFNTAKNSKNTCVTARYAFEKAVHETANDINQLVMKEWTVSRQCWLGYECDAGRWPECKFRKQLRCPNGVNMVSKCREAKNQNDCEEPKFQGNNTCEWTEARKCISIAETTHNDTKAFLQEYYDSRVNGHAAVIDFYYQSKIALAGNARELTSFEESMNSDIVV